MVDITLCGAQSGEARGRSVEAVLIPIVRSGGARPRTTLCISSQVGCAQNCQFCFTGRMGLQGNLSTAQMIEQVLPSWHPSPYISISRCVSLFLDHVGLRLLSCHFMACRAAGWSMHWMGLMRILALVSLRRLLRPVCSSKLYFAFPHDFHPCHVVCVHAPPACSVDWLRSPATAAVLDVTPCCTIRAYCSVP
jgi:hypothetical protein